MRFSSKMWHEFEGEPSGIGISRPRRQWRRERVPVDSPSQQRRGGVPLLGSGFGPVDSG